MEVQRPRILIIEDDPDIAALLCSMLRREGFPVATAENGPTALAYALSPFQPYPRAVSEKKEMRGPAETHYR